MPKATPEQLTHINEFTQVPLTEDQVYVFPNMLIDDQPTSYFSRIQPALLNKFVADANKGIALLMNHNNRQLPVGRSFGAYTRGDIMSDGMHVTSVYGDFYIDLGRKTESGMSTDDITKGIDAGTIFDTSIGFKAQHFDCSICGNDIRNFMACEHMPGQKYAVQRNGVDAVETCFVDVGKDGNGELLENSLVYAGAAPRAQITKGNFSEGNVSDSEKGSTLHLVDTFKNIPLDANIYLYYSKEGSVLYTDTDVRTNGNEVLRKRSESQVELAQLMEVLDQFGVKAGSAEELKTALAAAMDKSEVEAKLTQATTDLVAKDGELAAKASEIETVKGQFAAKDEVIAELTVKNEELSAKAGLADTYREDLTNETIEYGVRVMGNSFNTELYTKFLGTLSVDEVKAQLASFKAQHAEKFAGARTTEATPVTGRFTAVTGKEAFETEEEFRAHVADEAAKLSKETGISLIEATKQKYAELSAKESE